MTAHNWRMGWPDNVCLDCGEKDPYEVCTTTNPNCQCILEPRGDCTVQPTLCRGVVKGLAQDEEFLAYVQIHAETPRALFSREQIVRLAELAGEPIADDLPEWAALRNPLAQKLVDAARKRLKEMA